MDVERPDDARVPNSEEIRELARRIRPRGLQGLYGYDDDGRPMWDDCPGCGYAPGDRDDGLCPSCAAEAAAEANDGED